MRTYRKDREGLDASRIPSDAEIMWAAGVYEGEGSCVQSGHNRGSYTVSIHQKDPELLYRLKDIFGGSVKFYKGNGGGGVVKKSHDYDIYAWRICGDRCRLFVAAVYPYLTARRKVQIDSTLVREFLDFAGELPQVDRSTFSVHAHLVDTLKRYIKVHSDFAKEKRRIYMQKYDQQDGPKTRRRLYMRELRRKKDTVDTKGDTANVIKFA